MASPSLLLCEVLPVEHQLLDPPLSPPFMFLRLQRPRTSCPSRTLSPYGFVTAGLLTASYDTLHPHASFVGTIVRFGGLDDGVGYRKVNYYELRRRSKLSPDATSSPNWGFMPTNLKCPSYAVEGEKRVRDATTFECHTVYWENGGWDIDDCREKLKDLQEALR
ncbi:hypothetical protein BDQ17DRAFT_1502497 [Cyathus striatus]|nr:hypothetical protein BDQ17DRAFT_1502497 [Cyathus striatus]